MVKGGNWYNYFWDVVNPALGINPDAWKQWNEVFDDMYDGGKFFETHLSKDAPFLALGVGYGGLELILANRGWKGLGVDKDRDALLLGVQNSQVYAPGKIMFTYVDFYNEKQFPKFFVNKGFSSCISFGTMEHFSPEDIPKMIDKQFEIAPLIIFMVPVGTEPTLKFFGAKKVGPHVEEKSGIYRVLQPSQWWKDILKDYNLLDTVDSKNKTTGHDMTTFVVIK